MPVVAVAAPDHAAVVGHPVAVQVVVAGAEADGVAGVGPAPAAAWVNAGWQYWKAEAGPAADAESVGSAAAAGVGVT